MEEFLRNFFIKYDSLNTSEKKKLINELNDILDVKTVSKSNVHPSDAKPKKSGFQPTQSKNGKHKTITDLTEKKDLVLYESLRQWRNKVAKDLDLQPWLVFNNAVLTNIAFYKPQTPDDLLKINGIGQEKVGKYSEAILEIVNAKSSKDIPKKKAVGGNIRNNIRNEVDPFEEPVIRRRLASNK
jgi:superfamily II DNA helicase RecQ